MPIQFTENRTSGVRLNFSTNPRARMASIVSLDYSQITGDPSSGLVKVESDETAFSLADRFGRDVSVEDFGAVCNGTTDDSEAFREAITYAVTNSINRIYMPDKPCAIGSTITINYPIIIESYSAKGEYPHDTEVNGGARLVWTGSAGGTMLDFVPIAGGSNNALSGVGLRGVSLIGGNSGGRGLRMRGVAGGILENVYAEEWTTAGIEFESFSGALGDYKGVVGVHAFGVRGKQYLSSAPSLRLGGLLADSSNANGCSFVNCNFSHKDGPAVAVQGADNIRFYSLGCYRHPSGTAYSVILYGGDGSTITAANGISFWGASLGGGIEAQGTDTSGVTAASYSNFLRGYDSTNGSPAPVIGTGATFNYEYDNGDRVVTGNQASAFREYINNNSSNASASAVYQARTAVSPGDQYQWGAKNGEYFLGIASVADLLYMTRDGHFRPGSNNAQTFGVSATSWSNVYTYALSLRGSSSGTGTLSAPAAASTYAWTLPAATTTLVGTDFAQTLTNKTIALGSNTVSGTTAQFNTALSDGDFATLAGSEALTNKTINLSSNTLTGTTAQFNTALSDGDFATIAGAETLTNKTLTTPIISTISNTGTVTLPTATDTLVGRATTDTLTNKSISGSANTLTNIPNSAMALTWSSWSPTYAGTTGSPTVSTTRARYCQVGKLVHIYIDLNFTSINGATGDFYIGNLPVTAVSADMAGAVSGIEYTGGHLLGGVVDGTNARIFVIDYASSSLTTGFKRIHGTYEAA